MKYDNRKKFNDFINDLEQCSIRKQYQNMNDIYAEMERLNSCDKKEFETIGKVHTYFVPLLEKGQLQLPYELIYRRGIHENDQFMIRVVYDIDNHEYLITAGNGFRLLSVRTISKYKVTVDKTYCIYINNIGKAKLNLKQGDIIQITLIDKAILLNKFERPYPYMTY